MAAVLVALGALMMSTGFSTALFFSFRRPNHPPRPPLVIAALVVLVAGLGLMITLGSVLPPKYPTKNLQSENVNF